MKKINVNYKNQIFTKESLSKNKVLAEFLIKYFFKSKLSPIISFLLPILFMLVYYVTSSNSNTNGISFFFGSLPVYITWSILPITLISLPQIIVELKNSIILRRIKNSGFTKNNFLALIFILYFLLSVFFTIVIIGLFFIFLSTMNDPDNIKNDLLNIDVGGLIYSIFFLIISSLSVGIFLSSIIKNVSYALMSGIIVMLVTTILAGQFIPLFVLAGTEAFRYLSLLSPITYGASLLNNILVSPIVPPDFVGPTIDQMQNIFDFTSKFVSQSQDGEMIVIYETWQKGLNVIMPIIVSVGFSIVSIIYFKWFGR